MKKIIYVISALALIFTSCSTDGDTSPLPTNPSNVLVKKIIDTDAIGDVVTTNITYNGNKLVSMIDDSEEVDMYYTYTGDYITKCEYKLNDGTLDQVDNYSYDANGRIISMVSIQPNVDWGNKEVYTYNEDGTVSVIYYSGDDVSQTNIENTGKIYFANDEVTKIELFEDGTLNETILLTYDAKNNPLKNIKGYNKLNFTFAIVDGAKRNILSENSTVNGLISYSYTYESNDYPKSYTETFNGESSTTQFFYQ